MEMMMIVLMSAVLLALSLDLGMHIADGITDEQVYAYLSKVYHYIKGSKVGMWVNEYKVEMGIWCVGMGFIAVVTLVVPTLI